MPFLGLGLGLGLMKAGGVGAVGIVEAASGEWVNLTTFSSDSAVGTLVWNTVNNAKFSDDAWAFSNTPGFGAPKTSHYLKCLNLAKKIPSDAVPTAIEVRIERSVTVGTGTADNIISLVKGGSVVGDNDASVSAWPAVDAYAGYDGVLTLLWNLTFTAAEYNAADTGVAISVTSNDNSNAMLIDHVQMRSFF